ncbi:sequence-specific DNA binding transcription factor [Actinidia rufa]|uniref:Sequence-specific DNA binding transcription factor n=1 Tax=Actinidia rufa TaxID=165716 RepID=A0A7J0G064_9ERIC|nr:sequence-specific DNA binding transcription factor [Actinidia rufa]
MEDDEEIQSHPSPDTGSPVSPPNGRITVTVAAAPSQNNTLTLALPIQQPRPAGNGGGREDCWSEGATSVLIDAWGERYMELSRGNLKQKHWKEVADIVSSREDYTKLPKTDIQCKNRIDTVKKKYKVENSKIVAGGGPSKWPFFERLDHLIGPTAKTAGGSASIPSIPSGGHKVPMGIPVGVRSVHQFQLHQKQQQQKQKQKQKQKLRRQAPIDSDSSGSESEPPSPDSIDSFPPETYVPKRPRMQREMNLSAVRPAMNQRSKDGAESEKNWGNSVRELTRAILKFGEAYEQAESSKLQQLVEMEKQRMKFAKELELQRMQFFMKTQLELSQLKHRRAGNSNHHNNNNNINNNNSDCSS